MIVVKKYLKLRVFMCLMRGEKMIKVVMKIEGMACGMCESHINDTIRKNYPSG